MPAVTTVLTDATAYPVYASKALALADLVRELEQGATNIKRLWNIVYRLSNTNTSTFADPIVRHDA